jgi:hypothetical protein
VVARVKSVASLCCLRFFPIPAPPPTRSNASSRPPSPAVSACVVCASVRPRVRCPCVVRPSQAPLCWLLLGSSQSRRLDCSHRPREDLTPANDSGRQASTGNSRRKAQTRETRPVRPCCVWWRVPRCLPLPSRRASPAARSSHSRRTSNVFFSQPTNSTLGSRVPCT